MTIEAPEWVEGYRGAKIPIVGEAFTADLGIGKFILKLIELNSDTKSRRDNNGNIMELDAEVFFRTNSRRTPAIVARGSVRHLGNLEDVNRAHEQAIRRSRDEMNYGPGSSDRPGSVYYKVGHNKYMIGELPTGVGSLKPILSYDLNVYVGEVSRNEPKVLHYDKDVSQSAFIRGWASNDEGYRHAVLEHSERIQSIGASVATLLGSQEFIK